MYPKIPPAYVVAVLREAWMSLGVYILGLKAPREAGGTLTPPSPPLPSPCHSDGNGLVWSGLEV